MIKVLFFAQLAEDAECNEVAVDHLPAMSVRTLVDQLVPLVAAKAVAQLRHDFVVLSVNQALADWDAELADGDEVGFLPPFSGG